ncbi:ComF family protein [Tamlana agarivorans]|uniref:ComF family protein n=1 Tax=Pseudotamlana agarivorans TaxID=481183 RepID=A0ACC5U8V7_9FLAO|nr:ComF family protein [Tamlana agarivorans]MBU2950732.1 ComF family protein [Tamlana agarivorans]
MLKSIVNLFFPKVCYACQQPLHDNEVGICIECRHDLPVTNFHFTKDKSVEKVLYGRIKVENSTALFRFEKKSTVQHLIHNLKYKNHEDIGILLGNWLGAELKTLETYNNIDIVIPVPLHKKKLRKRGYNQVSKFGKQLAEALNAEYKGDILLKVSKTKSQVSKKRLARWQNNSEQFTVHHIHHLENKHILLVDDIITTGATIESCATVLNAAKNIKISIATMAIA